MMAQNKRVLYSFSLLVILSLFFTFSIGMAQAENISFEKAVKLGLENNSEIQDIKKNIENLKRNRKIIKTNNDWKIDLGGNYSHRFDESISTSDENDSSISITADKSYKSGLSLNPTVRIDEDEERLDISLTQPIYPIDNSIEDRLYDNKKELVKTRAKLKSLKSTKILSWVQSYLNIVRMEENKEIYAKSVIKAKDNLEKVTKKAEIGEAGDQQLLTAEYSLKDAKYKLKKQKINIREEKNSLKNNLGINKDKKIVFNSDNQFIEELRKKANSLTAEYMKEENLIKIIEKNNNDLQNNKINREILKRELEDLKKEDNISIKLSGEYDTISEDATATVDFSYNLYDSGNHDIDLESKKSAIADNRDKYKDIYKKLKLDLESHLNRLDLDKEKLSKEKLNYQRSQNKLEITKEKYDIGAVDYLEYQDSWIKTKETKIKLKSLKDSILINKLEFINFISNENIAGGF